MKNETTITKTKKREKVIIKYTDGTTEEYDNGILFTLERIKNENNELVDRLTAKHCNTKGNFDTYAQGLGYIIMDMLENEEKYKKIFNQY